MENITFCIPYHCTDKRHALLLSKCIERIHIIHPECPILVCKTSESYIDDFSKYEQVKIFNTFRDNSHIIGAMELLLRECKTSNFIICHDSMLLLKALPKDICDRSYYGLWYFDFCRDWVGCLHMLDHTILTQQEKEKIIDVYYNEFEKKWVCLFGPAFGGTMGFLRELWCVMNITPENIHLYDGRNGLEFCERLIAILAVHLGQNTMDTLNGYIRDCPFQYERIHDFNQLQNILDNIDTYNYDSFFFKIWQERK